MRVSFLILFLILPIAARPIGRTGNGRLADVSSGFVTVLPDLLPDVQDGADGSVRMLNPNVQVGPQGPPIVLAQPFKNFYPVRAKLDRGRLKTDFALTGWKHDVLPQDRCVDLYYASGGSASTVVAVWGVGKGVTFVGSQSGFTTSAIEQLIKNLELTPGACAWK